MAKELAFVLINPYTIAKSRTGGVIGRFLSRTGLELVAARMFAPGKELIEQYAEIVGKSEVETLNVRKLLSRYILQAYVPHPVSNLPQRVFLLLLEGENAIRKVASVAGPALMGGGETVRDTFGDYVTDEDGHVQYFEPAVLVGGSRSETKATLRLWARYSATEGGVIHDAADVHQRKGWENTLVLIKPDNFRFPNARPGNIIDILSRSGLRIIAGKVHRMSVVEAESFYEPIRENLHVKMASQITQRANKILSTEFKLKIPSQVITFLEKTLGPLSGDIEFNKIVEFMTGFDPLICSATEKKKEGRNKCLVLVYAGVNAVAKIRSLLGSTDPTKAIPGSVRREFGSDIMVNAAHASDSVGSSEREMAIIHMQDDTIPEWVEKYYR